MGGHVSRDDLLRGRIDSDLPGDENKSVGFDGLGVGADGLRVRLLVEIISRIGEVPAPRRKLTTEGKGYHSGIITCVAEQCAGPWLHANSDPNVFLNFLQAFALRARPEFFEGRR